MSRKLTNTIRIQKSYKFLKDATIPCNRRNFCESHRHHRQTTESLTLSVQVIIFIARPTIDNSHNTPWVSNPPKLSRIRAFLKRILQAFRNFSSTPSSNFESDWKLSTRLQEDSERFGTGAINYLQISHQAFIPFNVATKFRPRPCLNCVACEALESWLTVYWAINRLTD